MLWKPRCRSARCGPVCRVVAAAIALFVTALHAIAAQEIVTLSQAARIRLSPRQEATWTYGRFRTMVADSLEMEAPNDAGVQRFALADFRLEARVYDPAARTRYMAIGLAAGATAGILVLARAVRHCEATSTSHEGPPCSLGYIATPYFALGGGFLGGVAGLIVPADRWSPIALR